MSVTFGFEVKKEPNRNGQYQVFIRVTKDRKLKRIKTSVALNRLSDWNPKAKMGKFIRQSEPHSASWNDALSKELESAIQEFRKNEDVSLSALVDTIKHKDRNESFLQFAKEKVNERSSKEAIGTFRHYKTLVNKIENFLMEEGKTDMAFNEVNVAFITKFESYLGRVESQRYSGRKLHKNTIAGTLKKLRTLVNIAVDEELIQMDKNPFRKFSIVEEKTAKEKLTEEEVDRILALDLKPGSGIWNTRNCFLFSLYNAGIRAGDLLQLRWKNVQGGRLVYQMGKNHKVRDYKLIEQAEEILEYYRTDNVKASDYIFPFLNSNTTWAKESYEGKETMSDELKNALFSQVASKNVILNKNLKKIAEKAEISKNLTFHTSRHTFANMAMKENLPTSQIKGLLAHSSVATTEKYMGNFSKTETDLALQRVFTKKPEQENKNPNVTKAELIEILKGLDKDMIRDVLSELNNQ